MTKLRMTELVDEEYNVESSTFMRLEDLIALAPVASTAKVTL